MLVRSFARVLVGSDSASSAGTEHQQVSTFNKKQAIPNANISEMKMRIKRDSPCLVLRFMPINKLGKCLVFMLLTLWLCIIHKYRYANEKLFAMWSDAVAITIYLDAIHKTHHNLAYFVCAQYWRYTMPNMIIDLSPSSNQYYVFLTNRNDVGKSVRWKV